MIYPRHRHLRWNINQIFIDSDIFNSYKLIKTNKEIIYE